MRCTVVVGNPNAGGRTTRVGEAVARRVAALVGGEVGHETVELADVAPHLFAFGHPEVTALTARVAESDLLVVASPTYKASFTGLLKSFLDWYGADGLAGTVAVPVMVGAGARHALAVEVHLRPVLVELGCVVPSRGLYVLEPELEHLDPVLDAWLAGAGPALERSLR